MTAAKYGKHRPSTERGRPTVIGALLGIALLSQATSANLIENKTVVTDADNALLATGIGASIAAHNAALVLAFSPDPVIGGAAEVTAYGANIVLKYIPPVLEIPADLAMQPNTTDQCAWNFTMPQTSWKRVDFLGVAPLSPLPNDWGALGAPDALHANTDVVVRARSPFIPLADEPPRVGIFARNEPANAVVSFPAGNHAVRWEAEAQLDPIMDLYLPPILLLAASEFRYGSIGLSGAGEAGKNLAKTQRTREIAVGLLQEAGLLVGGEALDEADLPPAFQGMQTAAHHRLQNVTVFDVLPPSLELPQSVFRFEASGFGGKPRSEFWEQEVRPTFIASDPCDRPVSLSDSGPETFYPIGNTLVDVTATDLGPTVAGGRNSITRQMQVIVEDTQAPIIVAPSSRVVEIPASESGIDPVALMLGRPRVVDLADASPSINNDGPAFYPINSRASIIWSATDASGNTGTARQFVTVKAEGTNTTPVAEAATASTLTSQPVDIVLRGSDSDFIDDRFDPLSFIIETPPARGEFVAPLLPFFIEDYRTNPAGPYGEDFLLGTGFSGNKFNWMTANVCEAAENPIPGLARGEIDQRFVFEPEFVKVLDDGTYFMLDKSWSCRSNRSRTDRRISKWSKDDEYLGQIDYSGDLDHFVLDDDGFLYQMSLNGSGSSSTLQIRQCGTDFENFRGGHCGRSWKFDFSSADNIRTESLAYARVDAQRGVLYLADNARVFVFDVRDTPASLPGEVFVSHRPEHVGTLFNGERLLGAVVSAVSVSCGSGVTSGFSMDIDSEGNLYVSDFCDHRIHKFTASEFSESGNFEIGEHVGWLGFCESSTNKACDAELKRSKGYSCTNSTCPATAPRATAGDEAGQFAAVSHLVVGPNDILYAADPGNSRIQRFAPDGTFVGQAVSTGTGINQGDQPGFVLGNFGRARTVSVNRSNFFVVDSDEELVHLFQTSPFKDITDNSATVTYVSEFDAQGITDTFSYTATDGLATSAPATAMVTVNRNFRTPEAIAQPNVAVLEDTSVDIALTGDDPDGIAGVDFNGLDTLTFRIVRNPESGSLSGADALLTYTPAQDFTGQDYFLFVVSDGLEESPPARVDINVVPVDDAPRVTELGLPDTWGQGFPLLMAGTFFDDGQPNNSTLYNTQLNWGDGTIVERGDFVDGPEGMELVGVKIVEPYNGVGRGQAIAEHTFTSSSNRTVNLCVSDESAMQTCAQESINILPLVKLDPGVFVPVETVPQGESATVAVTLTNVQPIGYTGVPATNVRLEQVRNANLEVVNIEGAPNGCGLIEGALDCTIAFMAPGASIGFTTDVRYLGSEFFDAQASFTIKASNLTPAVVPSAVGSSIVSFAADTTDTDNDGLSDPWEIAFGLIVGSNDAQLDGDNDGLTNAQEFAAQTDPGNADTDNDGFPDGVEVENQTSPTVAADTDGDGTANDIDLDDDNDGMLDEFERAFGLDALNGDDALADRDGDGVSNLAEAQAGTSPIDANDTPVTNSETPTLFSSVLPLSRATTIGNTVGAFATILNTGSQATNCAIAPLAPMAAGFSYQATDPASNTPIGTPNSPVDIAAGAAQSFVFQFTPREELNSVVEFRFGCESVSAARTVNGVNTFVLQSSLNPTADLIALSATSSADGIMTLDGGVGAFGVASVNVGAEGLLTARTRSPDGLPVNLTLCETNPNTGQCMNPVVPEENTTVLFFNGATPTFSVFASSTGDIAFLPETNRVFVEFIDDAGVVRGSTSVAIRSIAD